MTCIVYRVTVDDRRQRDGRRLTVVVWNSENIFVITAKSFVSLPLFYLCHPLLVLVTFDALRHGSIKPQTR